MPKPVIRKGESPAPVPMPHRETPWDIRDGRDRRVEFRGNGNCTGLPDTEFNDNGRRVRRINGQWEVEAWPELHPGDFMVFKGEIVLTSFYDLKAEVLAGNPIPAAVVEHDYLLNHHRIWPESLKHWPGRLLSGYDFYMSREDGEYESVGSEYVFNPPKRTRTLTLKPKPAPVAKPAPRMRGDDEDELPLFTRPRLRE